MTSVLVIVERSTKNVAEYYCSNFTLPFSLYVYLQNIDEHIAMHLIKPDCV